jgi:hypothetical protein
VKYAFLIVTAALALTAPPIRADDSAVPGAGFPASRYEVLWTKSPFAVATAEAAAVSPDYSLVGISNIEGVSYAGLIDKQKNEHFLVSTDKPTRGMTLTSITVGHNGSDTLAVVQKDGELITLKLEQAPGMAAAPNPNAPPINIPMPNITTPPLPMPGALAPYPGQGVTRPFARFHRPLINLPPRPGQQQQLLQIQPAPQQPLQIQPPPQQPLQIQPPPPPH